MKEAMGSCRIGNPASAIVGYLCVLALALGLRFGQRELLETMH